MTNREMDALVAAKVMGLDVYTDTFGPLTKIGQRVYVVNDYSTNIAAAWEVVEKLKLCVWPTAQGRWFVFQSAFDESYGDEYWFGGEDFLKRDDTILADTAPMAICLAALHAVGVPIPKGE